MLTPKRHNNGETHRKKVVEEFAQFGKITRILEQPHFTILIAGTNGTNRQLTVTDFMPETKNVRKKEKQVSGRKQKLRVIHVPGVEKKRPAQEVNDANHRGINQHVIVEARKGEM